MNIEENVLNNEDIDEEYFEVNNNLEDTLDLTKVSEKINEDNGE